MVVSLMGNICRARWWVDDTKSTIIRRSPKSPTPKLPFDLSEKTGTSVPATFSSHRA